MLNKKLVIIGGGPAGLAAAISAYDTGVRDILIIERENVLGGILNQCIHNGFGLHTFNMELTGPEYAYKYIEKVKSRKIKFLLETTVININENKEIRAISFSKGQLIIKAESIILACGCRERSRGAINIAGSRCAGVYSAGTAQKLVNIDGYMPGKKVVILGSGDIGLIMARRMTFEGANVVAVIELMPYSSGLNRNIVQCLNDFDIPLYFSHTIAEIKGKSRVSSVLVSKVDSDFNCIQDSIFEIKCDTVLLSVGLIPENELARKAGIKISDVTKGAIVNDNYMTSVPGIFSCGNVLHVHDLVDFVSNEAAIAGREVSKYLKNKALQFETVDIKVNDKIRYIVPQKIIKNLDYEPLNFKIRVDKVYEDTYLELVCDGNVIYRKKEKILRPGEMETFKIGTDKMKKLRNSTKINVRLVD